MDNIIAAHKTKSVDTINEFIRYLFVGGSAFILDTGVFILTQRFVFYNDGEIGILIAAALGFMVGLIYNYILSIYFVFKKACDRVKGKQGRSFFFFAIIGIVGLGLTEVGMHLGIKLFDLQYYLFIKIFVSAVVLLWNYTARKVFIFK